MVISTKGRYALRLMIDLAQHCDEGFISLKTVSQRQDVSLKYMEAIAAALNRANLVVSQRGKEGGYRLSRPASDITVAEVLHSTEGSMAAVSCLDAGENGCERADQCLTLPMWKKQHALCWRLPKHSEENSAASTMKQNMQEFRNCMEA